MAPRSRKPKEFVAPVQASNQMHMSITYLQQVAEMCKTNNIKYFKSPELELHFGEDIKLPENLVAAETADKENYKEQVLGDLLLENPLAYEEALNRE